ncbi:hypothetical protein [Anaeromyxobacter oryzae]|uniref:hypothetical protein n=1 Tax=Anaeromyxobacter oryzae TaxID=2918170 RepID=UPI0020BFADF1|nr:hypothetical protein [Anaeromyxobacter oryzae]
MERKLRVEEERARGLRAQLARAAGTPKRIVRPKLSAAILLDRLADLAEIAAKKPRQARARLAELVETVVLMPQGDGRLKATLRLKSETAALASGRPGVELTGCGGPHLPSESPAPGPISFFMPRLRAHSPRLSAGAVTEATP